MTVRLLVPVVACVATVLTAPAVAAPRKVCNLLKGTGSFTYDRGLPYEAPLTISSADIASNKTTLTAVVRVQDIAPPTAAVSGRFFVFFFSRHEEENYMFDGELWPGGGTTFALGRSSEPFDPKANEVAMPETTWFATPKVVVDEAKDEIRFSVPLSVFRKSPSSSMKHGQPVTFLGAMSGTMYGVDRSATPVPEPVPTAAGTGGDFEYGSDRIRYRLGAPSCVAVGR